MDVLELIYDYFEDRSHASALIRQRRPYALGLLGALVGGVAVFVAESLSGHPFFLSFSWPSLVLSLLWQATMLFASAALLHLLLDMTGARGDAGALFVHLGLSELAWLAAVPATLVAQAVFSSPAWPTRLIWLGAWGWALALKARALRDEYGVGEGRAWLTLGLPLVALASLVALSTTMAVIAFIIKVVS
jgi:hypothetical protein